MELFDALLLGFLPPFMSDRKPLLQSIYYLVRKGLEIDLWNYSKNNSLLLEPVILLYLEGPRLT